MTPVPCCGCAPALSCRITPKSTRYQGISFAIEFHRNRPLQSAPPILLAGPLCFPLFTAKSSITPFFTSTRTTLKPAACKIFPVDGASSPRIATNASPGCPNFSLREKSKPSAKSVPQNARPESSGGLFGCFATNKPRLRFVRRLKFFPG